MTYITFNYRSQIQARFVEFKTHQLGLPKTNENYLDVALRFGDKLAQKIDKKYFTLNSLNLKRDRS